MSAKATVLFALAIGILGAGVWAGWYANQAEAAEPTKMQPPLADEAPPPIIMPMVTTGDTPPPKPQQNPRDTSLMTKLPDGSYIRNLNGVREPMTWSGPFSPIVGIRRTDIGVDWWVHENGMQSTVIIVAGTINGVPVRQAMLNIAFPTNKIFPIGEAAKKN